MSLSESEFLRFAFHELNQPLTVLRGELELALRLPGSAALVNEPLQQQVIAAIEEADRLIVLTRALRDLAEARQACKPRLGSVTEILTALAQAAEEAGAARGIPLECLLEPAPPVHLDAAQVRQGLEFIVHWLLRGARPGIPVRLCCAPIASDVHLTLSGQVDGIADANAEALFDLTGRKLAAPRLAAEDRLRLAAAGQLMENSGARIQVSANQGQWTFQIVFSTADGRPADAGSA